MNRKRALRSALILITAFAVSGLIAFAQIKTYQVTQPQNGVAGMDIGGPFRLSDQDGKSFTEKDLDGRYTLLYFGFTSCPAICPTELQKVNVAMGQAGAVADKVQPVFITIDPDRDTQKVMKAYVTQFHPRLIGLTGTQGEIDVAAKAYHVYARKVKDAKLSDYTMDHSSYIYFIGPDRKVIALYGPSSTAGEIAAAIRASVTR